MPPTYSKAVRTDDGSGLNIRTATITEATETRHIQTVAIADPDDGTSADVVGEGTIAKGLTAYGSDGTTSRAIRTSTAGETLAVAKITDGTNVAEVGSNKRLKVETAAKTSDDQPYGIGIDDGYPLFALANDSSPDSVDEGDAGVIRMSLNRNLYTQVRDGLGNERGAAVTAANALKVDGSAVTQPVSGTVAANAGTGTMAVSAASLPLPAGAATAALQLPDGHNVTVSGTVTANAGTGTMAVSGPLTDTQLRATAVPVSGTVTASGPLTDTQLRATAVPVSGTVTAAQATAANLKALVDQGAAGTAWEIVGDVAADIAVPANPVVVGGRASTAVPTAVSADGDSVNTWLTRQGANVVTMAPHVGLFASQPWDLTSKTAQYATQQTSTILVNGGAGERIVVTSIQIQVGNTTAGTVQVYFGTGAYSRGTNLAIFDGEFAPSATLKPGVVMQGPFISATNGDDILVTTSAGMTITVTVWYYVVT